MTIYNLATSSSDYKACKKFLQDNDEEPVKLSFPTIIARRDNKVIGLLSTRPNENSIIAGPLVNPKRNGLLYLNLVEAYEGVLIRAGVKEYVFNIPQTETDYLDQIFRATRMTPFTFKDGLYWFRRII